MDGDGYLDVLLGAHEFEKSIDFTGIVWNDGRGNFNKHNNTRLPQHKKKWGTVPEVSAADLDNDGDLDIVYSRAGDLYVGTAIQIIENLGNKKFKDHGIFPLVVPPADYIPTHEGNEWNDFIENIRFRDLDKDGNIDLYLSSSMSSKTDGMVLLNQGDFNFELLRPSAALEIGELAEYEAQRKKAEDAEFADAIAKRKAEVAAAKAKRLAEEEAAKSAETDTVDTEQSIEDEIAAFEAELAAELGE
jgi:hypothetical protein